MAEAQTRIKSRLLPLDKPKSTRETSILASATKEDLDRNISFQQAYRLSRYITRFVKRTACSHAWTAAGKMNATQLKMIANICDIRQLVLRIVNICCIAVATVHREVPKIEPSTHLGSRTLSSCVCYARCSGLTGGNKGA